MAELFKRILCPVDTDDVCLPALETARDLAEENHGDVYLLHVVPLLPSAGVLFPADTFALMQEQATRFLKELAREHLEGKTGYRISVAIGDPATQILESAQAMGVGSIVMATHGRKGLARLLLGSVTAQVVQKAPCPVLTLGP
jgi:nucleotide-binding universal stress UspA family protein